MFKGQLRIQKEALGWFVFLKQFSFGGMLADDMGLGKTIEVFAMLAGEDRSGPPSLIVTSTSLVLTGRGRPGVLSLI
ncbi:MAG: SNF2-related protein [Dissulfurimicrobium sp.]|uniref:SNF2-related protein n=1 Tax=Dissulfurimicrobium sp. TaxID=2022436 RepID=UPI004049618E